MYKNGGIFLLFFFMSLTSLSNYFPPSALFSVLSVFAFLFLSASLPLASLRRGRRGDPIYAQIDEGRSRAQTEISDGAKPVPARKAPPPPPGAKPKDGGVCFLRS